MHLLPNNCRPFASGLALLGPLRLPPVFQHDCKFFRYPSSTCRPQTTTIRLPFPGCPTGPERSSAPRLQFWR